MTSEVERGPWIPEDGTRQPLIQYNVTVLDESAGPHHAGYALLTIDAGPRGHDTVIPPAGAEYAYDRPRWARRVQVTVSPKGRSARVWVDGVEIPSPPTHPKETPNG